MATNAAFLILAAGAPAPTALVAATSSTAAALPSNFGKIAVYCDAAAYIAFGTSSSMSAASASAGWPVPAGTYLVFDRTPAYTHWRAYSTPGGNIWVVAAS
jgi:hypothetical protein